MIDLFHSSIQDMYCCVLDSVQWIWTGFLYRSVFDVSDGQFICKINRTSSKLTAFNLNTVEMSEDISNNNNNNNNNILRGNRSLSF